MNKFTRGTRVTFMVPFNQTADEVALVSGIVIRDKGEGDERIIMAVAEGKVFACKIFSDAVGQEYLKSIETVSIKDNLGKLESSYKIRLSEVPADEGSVIQVVSNDSLQAIDYRNHFNQWQ